MELNLQGKIVPFVLEFKDQTATLFNSSEKRVLHYSQGKDGSIDIPILGFDAAFKLKKINNTLSGYWIKFNRSPEYKLSIMGMKLAKPYTYLKEPLQNFPSKWQLTFDGDKKSNLLSFTNSETSFHGSIITQTGDYRFLTPKIKDNNLSLFGFDGAYAFFIEAKRINDKLQGTLYSGLSYNKKFTAQANKDFKLKDPEQITSYDGDITKLNFKTLSGEDYQLSDDNGKVRVLQIFGSWCPNCIDETAFINNWKKRNKNLNVHFSLIAFERSPDKKHALKQLKKAKDNYGINYPILIGGYTKKDKVKSILPGLENFISFPTTIYIDKQGKVRKILASFQGPATGQYYNEFSRNFDLFLKKLAQEE